MRLSENAAVVVESRGRYCLSHLRQLAASAVSTGTNSGWVNLAMVGRWEGHPTGPFEFTPETFAQMKANFDKNRTPIKFDYEHQTMNGQPGPKPASGHIKALELRDNGATLWGFVDWTPKAAEMIRGGEYNFCSPVVAFRAIDKKTGQEHGAELLQCALTDDPFLDGQAPIQLSFTAANSMYQDPNRPPAPMNQLPPVPPPQPAPMGDMTQPPPMQQPPVAPMAAPPPPPNGALPPDPSMMAAPPAPPPAPEPPPAPSDKGQADGNALVDMLADATGGDRAAVLKAITDNLDQVVAIVQKQIANTGKPVDAEKRQMSKAPEDEAEKARRIAAIEASKKDADIVALTKQVEVLATAMSTLQAAESARAKRAIEVLVDQKIAEGFVEQAGREDAIWLFTNAPERAATVYGSKRVPLATSQANPEPEGAVPTAEPKMVNGVIDVKSLSKNQAIAFNSLLERYKGDEAVASKMFSKLNLTKGSVH